MVSCNKFTSGVIMAQAKQHGEYLKNWDELARSLKERGGWKCVRCGIHARGSEIGVHHFDGNRENNEMWNLMVLCRRCHLSLQGRVDPRNPIFFDPSVWAMPYIAGVYAAGLCVPPTNYSLTRWIAEYEASGRSWPTWAEVPRVIEFGTSGMRMSAEADNAR